MTRFNQKLNAVLSRLIPENVWNDDELDPRAVLDQAEEAGLHGNLGQGLLL